MVNVTVREESCHRYWQDPILLPMLLRKSYALGAHGRTGGFDLARGLPTRLSLFPLGQCFVQQ